jgi:hypothetical protein
MKGEKMATKHSKNREYCMTSDALLDRLIDGKVVDTGEMYDRLMLTQQVGMMLSIPVKHSPKRVR